jgi:hypothetical protein
LQREAPVFHVEIRDRRGMRRVWAFNLSHARLVAEVLAPWEADARFDFADQAWEPSESEIRILRGPALDPVELAHGQGPGAAEKASADVTSSLLAEAGELASDRARTVAAQLLSDLAAIDDVSPQNEQALDLVAGRLRALGLG